MAPGDFVWLISISLKINIFQVGFNESATWLKKKKWKTRFDRASDVIDFQNEAIYIHFGRPEVD